MAYCPDCLAEYREGATECADCQVALLPGPPPAVVERKAMDPEPQLVRLRTFYGPTAPLQATLAKKLLEAQGIASMSPGEEEPIPGIDALQIWVREEDAEHAAEVLNAYLDAPQPEAASNGVAPIE